MTDASEQALPERKQALSWSGGLGFRRVTGRDWRFFLVLIAFAAGAVFTGHRAAKHVAPRDAKALGGMLDKLEMPRQFRDAPLKDEAGLVAGLYARAETDRAIVAFYAPWCGPCQKELPELYEAFSEKLTLLVVISADDDPKETRDQLDNIGMNDLGFLIDVDRHMQRDGRVTALPSTFLIAKGGHILDRMEGYGEMQLYRIKYRAGLED